MSSSSASAPQGGLVFVIRCSRDLEDPADFLPTLVKNQREIVSQYGGTIGSFGIANMSRQDGITFDAIVSWTPTGLTNMDETLHGIREAHQKGMMPDTEDLMVLMEAATEKTASEMEGYAVALSEILGRGIARSDVIMSIPDADESAGVLYGVATGDRVGNWLANQALDKMKALPPRVEGVDVEDLREDILREAMKHVSYLSTHFMATSLLEDMLSTGSVPAWAAFEKMPAEWFCIRDKETMEWLCPKATEVFEYMFANNDNIDI